MVEAVEKKQGRSFFWGGGVRSAKPPCRTRWTASRVGGERGDMGKTPKGTRSPGRNDRREEKEAHRRTAQGQGGCRQKRGGRH